jgi:hypothetical protein
MAKKQVFMTLIGGEKREASAKAKALGIEGGEFYEAEPAGKDVRVKINGKAVTIPMGDLPEYFEDVILGQTNRDYEQNFRAIHIAMKLVEAWKTGSTHSWFDSTKRELMDTLIYGRKHR